MSECDNCLCQFYTEDRCWCSNGECNATICDQCIVIEDDGSEVCPDCHEERLADEGDRYNDEDT